MSVINALTVRNFKYKQYTKSEGSILYDTPVSSDDTVDMSEFPNADNLNQVLIGQGVTETQIGIVAQELETVCPNLVDVSTEHGMKTVASSVLYMKAIKALQEAMTRIETLEQDNIALRVRVTNLEGN